jgi:hypothetical protein
VLHAQGTPVWFADLGAEGDARCRAIDAAMREPAAAVTALSAWLDVGVRTGLVADHVTLDAVYVLGLCEGRAVPALPVLRRALRTCPAALRQQVVWAIGAIGPHAEAQERHACRTAIEADGVETAETAYAHACLRIAADATDAELMGALDPDRVLECIAAAHVIASRSNASPAMFDRLVAVRADVIRVLARSPMVRDRACIALSRAVVAVRPLDGAAGPALYSLLWHQDHRERRRALEFLGQHHETGDDTLDAVARILDDPSDAVVRAAVVALASFGSRAGRYLEAVERVAARRERVAAAAVAAADRIRDERDRAAAAGRR